MKYSRPREKKTNDDDDTAALHPALLHSDEEKKKQKTKTHNSAAVPNLAMSATALYAAYYVALEPIAGTTWTACMGVPMWLSATAFQAALAPDAWKWVGD